jgi:S-formylglutathione hydrolase FrmB
MDLPGFNRCLHGKVLDYTANHGVDNRMWSRALYKRRDLYVYLPPGFDPQHRYPLIMLLHGFAQDERVMMTFAPLLDAAIVAGTMPPVIVACPDGSIDGEPSFFDPGSFFLNTRAGDFEDYILEDVWDFVVYNFPIRCERGAHVLAGVSMGGFAAFNLGIRHREMFGVIIGVYPPLNLRWTDDRGNYLAKFDPQHWGWRTEINRKTEIVARFAAGLVTLRLNHLLAPLFGCGEEALREISRENPIELVDRLGLRNGQLSMLVAYAGRDQFNIDAQVESFLYLCKCRGIGVGVLYDPMGRHDGATAKRFVPDILRWLSPQLAPYSPPLCLPVGNPCQPGSPSEPEMLGLPRRAP